MIIIINNETIEINYSCKTEQVNYCIADFGGNVLMRGDYNCDLNNLSRVSIKKMTKGLYTFCIIDGDSLTKILFHKT